MASPPATAYPAAAARRLLERLYWGAPLWADRFDGSLEDVFELQDKVAISVAGVIEPTLEAAETRRSAERPTNDLTALDLYLRALPDLDAFEKNRILRALDLLGQAIETRSALRPGSRVGGPLSPGARGQRLDRRRGSGQARQRRSCSTGTAQWR
jgi:hypothetical protein